MDKVQLLDDIANSFNTSELAELCMSLKVDYEDLGSGGKRSQARELIGYMERRGRLPELIQALVDKRPQLAATYQVAPSPDKTQPAETVGHPNVPVSPQPVAQPSQPEIQEPTNPYSAGRMVTDAEMFFGRENERRQLRTRLQTMSSCSIVGMRRVGKSSLMYYLSHHEPAFTDSSYMFAYLDLQDARYHTLAGLLSGAVTQWMQKAGQNEDEVVSTLADFSTWVRRFKAAGFLPVLCLDEFENLTKRPQEFTDDVFDSWRALGNAGQIAFITASLHSLSDLIKSGGLTSDFHTVFTELNCGLLDDSPARNLLTEPMARSGIVVDVVLRNDLLAYCGPHPFYLQMMGFYFCDAILNSDFAQEQVKAEFAEEAERHWLGLWHALSPEEQTAFLAVQKGETVSAAQTRVRVLARKGVLLSENGVYKPFSLGFSEWVAEQERPIPQPAANPPEVEAADNKPDDSPPEVIETPAELKPVENMQTGVDLKSFLVITLISLLVVVVLAWVLKTLIGDQSTGNLVLLLVVIFPFILVLVGKLTGQDLIAWFGQLLGSNKEE
ncbi:MAG: hypothetical protein IAF02_23940 [Anaerolineae bacterium]|nr:hypothetical protein [Anaerolineae bacterium]